MKIAIYVLGGLAGLFVIVMAVGMFTGPKTYREMADQEAQRCIDRGGVGTDWRASSGVPLELFCKTAAYAKAAVQQCHDHPEGC